MRIVRAALLLLVSAISPVALAAPCGGFVDVDDSNPAHAPFCDSVEWMKNRAITFGLTPTLYDPNSFVTRLQMAAFMYRLGFENAFLQGGNAFESAGVGVTAILGTTNPQPLDIRVNNARVMRYEPNAISPNVIGGSPANNVTAGVRGATIGGGGVPSGDTDPDYDNEGPNRVTDVYGTVGGGYANRAGDGAGTTTNQPFATVGGGVNNTASGFASTVAGGHSNTASGFASTVAGGHSNTASGFYSGVAGGIGNTASGFASTVPGGFNNTASGLYSIVAGGQSNMASVYISTVAGGQSNTASGTGSTVAGGDSNTASGQYSTVAGGLNNTAGGVASFAAGNKANANADGCFVWGDFSTTNEVTCGAANIFVVRSLGGVYFFSAGNTDAIYSGVQLLPGATAWVAASDRRLKENVHTVDTRDVLDRLLALPITTWNLKTQDPSIRHMGAMAQDFRAAFGLGETELGINTLDADGVALAAIKGLNAKLEAERAAKDAEIATLRAELAEIRSLLASRAAQSDAARR